MSSLLAYLPQHEGLLPKWLFFVGVTAVGNLVQAYRTLHFTSQVYLSPHPDRVKPPPGYQHPSETTPLHSRTFGTWTLLQGLVRLYAAYNVDVAGLYQLAMLTNIVAMWHFGTEWFVFGTTSWNKGLAGPVFVSIGTTLWMTLQYGFYVK
ncbi:putative ergosterol biosynthesis protein [Diplodia seriata]|uniref:Putative ergosterol biosynthesis protein n=1 Tax=Diplodia seriata TaxID=420778 RepID=A0A0G2E187_9PEZI|nr:putative ergosterol biosynthesis protein [Diplodia seriata]